MMCTTVVKYCMIHLLLSFLCFDLQIAVQSAGSTDSTTTSTVGNSTTTTDSTTTSTVGNSTTTTDSTTTSTVGNSTTTTDSTTTSTVGNSTTSTDSTTTSTVGNSTTTTDSTTTSTVGNSTTTTDSTTTSTVGNSTASTESTTTSTVQRSTSKKKPTPTTHVPTPPPRKKLILDEVNIPVPLKLKFNVTFKNDLKNKHSEVYRKKEAEYKEKLTSVYNETEGFKEIRINQFTKGSLVVDFEVIYDLQASNKTDFRDKLKAAVNKSSTKLPGIDEDFIKDQYYGLVDDAIIEVAKYQTDPCEIPDVCGFDYLCIEDKNEYVCDHKCSEHNSKCSNGGYCVLNTEHHPICLCPKKGDVIYGGEFCEETAEQLAMSKRDIIITASVGGGGLILILSLTIVYLCRKKKGKRAPKPVQVEGDDSEKSFKSMRNSQDGLHQSYTAKNNYTNYNNPTFRHFGGSLDQLSRDPYDVRTTQHSSWHTRDLSNGLELTPRGPTDQVDMRGPGRPSDPNASEIERSPDYGPYHANTSRTPDGPRQPALSSQVSNNYIEIDDNKSKAIMYRPTSIKQPLPGIQQIDHPLRPDDAPKVYDYYNHRQSAMSQSSRPSNRSSRVMSGDFDDDITVQHYAISRPHVSSQRRF